MQCSAKRVSFVCVERASGPVDDGPLTWVRHQPCLSRFNLPLDPENIQGWGRGWGVKKEDDCFGPTNQQWRVGSHQCITSGVWSGRGGQINPFSGSAMRVAPPAAVSQLLPPAGDRAKGGGRRQKKSLCVQLHTERTVIAASVKRRERSSYGTAATSTKPSAKLLRQEHSPEAKLPLQEQSSRVKLPQDQSPSAKPTKQEQSPRAKPLRLTRTKLPCNTTRTCKGIHYKAATTRTKPASVQLGTKPASVQSCYD